VTLHVWVYCIGTVYTSAGMLSWLNGQ